MSTVNYLVRVYANGEAKHTYRTDAGTFTWLEYNREARFGNALFVNGLCAHSGYFESNGKAICAIEKALKKEINSGVHSGKKPETIRHVRDFFGGIDMSYYGFPEEGHRKGFEYLKGEVR